jgi:hypothetical protein
LLGLQKSVCFLVYYYSVMCSPFWLILNGSELRLGLTAGTFSLAESKLLLGLLEPKRNSLVHKLLASPYFD